MHQLVEILVLLENMEMKEFAMNAMIIVMNAQLLGLLTAKYAVMGTF